MTEQKWVGFYLPIDTDHRNKAWTQQVAWFISALLLCIIVDEVRKIQLMTCVCRAWSLKKNTWRPLVLIKPSPEHRSLTCHWKNVVWRGDEKCGQSDAKAQCRAPHQTARSAPRCQDNLEKTCPQLLPQPQEGLTSHSLTHCRAPDTALYVTASWIEGGFSVSSMSENSQKVPRFLILLTIFLLWGFHIFLPPLCGREKEDKGEALIEVWVKINTPDLSWTKFHPNCSTHSRSILMHPRPPQNTRDHYYNSTVCDSPRLIEPVWENCSPRGAAGGQKCLERW